MKGFHEIKNHAFFTNFDWEALNEMKMPSPLAEIVKEFPVKPKHTFSTKNQEVPKDSGYQIEGLSYNPDTLKERNSNLHWLINAVSDFFSTFILFLIIH